jgi:hypothetical protein
MFMLCCSILHATNATCALKIIVEHPCAKENIVIEHSSVQFHVVKKSLIVTLTQNVGTLSSMIFDL